MPYTNIIPAKSITDNMLLPHQLNSSGGMELTIMEPGALKGEIIEIIAGERIIYGQLCYIGDDGRGYIASSDNSPAMFISGSMADVGDKILAYINGLFFLDNQYIPGSNLYLGNNGHLTTEYRYGRIIQLIGKSLNMNSIFIKINLADYCNLLQ